MCRKDNHILIIRDLNLSMTIGSMRMSFNTQNKIHFDQKICMHQFDEVLIDIVVYHFFGLFNE